MVIKKTSIRVVIAVNRLQYAENIESNKKMIRKKEQRQLKK